MAVIKSVVSIAKDFEDMLFNMTIADIKSNVKSLCVVGSTGTGKSSTCKTITGLTTNEIFNPSNSLTSETFETKGICTTWFGREDLEKIFVLDTPGLGDSDGRDTKHIA